MKCGSTRCPAIDWNSRRFLPDRPRRRRSRFTFVINRLFRALFP